MKDTDLISPKMTEELFYILLDSNSVTLLHYAKKHNNDNDKYAHFMFTDEPETIPKEDYYMLAVTNNYQKHLNKFLKIEGEKDFIGWCASGEQLKRIVNTLYYVNITKI
jgi:hypothetical protein